MVIEKVESEIDNMLWTVQSGGVILSSRSADIDALICLFLIAAFLPNLGEVTEGVDILFNFFRN